MVVHTCNPSTQKWRQQNFEFSLAYMSQSKIKPKKKRSSEMALGVKVLVAKPKDLGRGSESEYQDPHGTNRDLLQSCSLTSRSTTRASTPT